MAGQSWPKSPICCPCSNEALCSASVVMESFHHIFITAAISIFILTLLCAFIFRLIRCWRSKSSYELAAAVIQNKQFPQPEFYV
ncbi:hypothetical protein WUBG_08684 [Wuchereria bancrofti]|uniref:Uncharacterized protein n=1 Tax=Wuchereria bancrofti TaxID=6293 RepID=J9ETH2_WUCBA|nr:hypothetical protein WUBG_08684 [Wuchereria bancrofti]VDM07769.1 unnamed protein product [Wuchereria bancrofti]